MRTIVIGDVHGCIDELHELLAKLAPRAGEDRLIFAGDLVDRGPEPRACVRLVRELGAEAVLGNHEEKMLRWLRREREQRESGRENKMHPPPPERRAQWESIDEADVAWLEALPVMLRVEAAGRPWLVVHAGFEDAPLERQKKEIVVRCRFLDERTGKMKPIGGDGPMAQPAGTVYWTARWRGPRSVAYGHAVHGLEAPRVDRPAPGVECWGIDTGACFGGRLTALVLETREVVQVAAKEAYAELRA
jgi:bis(5'-nucleosyl)-tetraphosphatase (symmetrical)